MPDLRISGLTAMAAALATIDEFVMVDKSDTTMAATGSTRKVPTSTVLGDPLFAGILRSFASAAARTTAIPSPVDGQASYLNPGDATEGPEFYNGTAWRPAWNLPWGRRAHHVLTTAFSTAATHTVFQDEGLTLTVDDVANRDVLITASMHLYTPGGATSVAVALLRSGVQVAEFDVPSEALSTTTAHSFTFNYLAIGTAAAAGIVYKLQLKSLSAFSSSSYGAATFQRSLLYADIGPATGAPS